MNTETHSWSNHRPWLLRVWPQMGHLCHILPLRAQGTFQKREQKICKSQRSGKMEVNGVDRTTALLSAQQHLWLPERGQLVNPPAWMEKGHTSPAPGWGAADHPWQVWRENLLFFRVVAPGRLSLLPWMASYSCVRGSLTGFGELWKREGAGRWEGVLGEFQEEWKEGRGWRRKGGEYGWNTFYACLMFRKNRLKHTLKEDRQLNHATKWLIERKRVAWVLWQKLHWSVGKEDIWSRGAGDSIITGIYSSLHLTLNHGEMVL